MPKTKTNLY